MDNEAWADLAHERGVQSAEVMVTEQPDLMEEVIRVRGP